MPGFVAVQLLGAALGALAARGLFDDRRRHDPSTCPVGRLARAGPSRPMSLESVRAWLAEHACDLPLIDNGASTATVELAARALGVAPGRIAKTLAIRVKDEIRLIVARGDARLDNRKTKAAFGGRPRMLDAAETLAATGHAVGGVCPFGLAHPIPVHLDVSLRAFDTVFPAAGSLTSSVEVAPDRLADLLGAGWIDVCRLPEG
jgi:prolyl-tRNA editing enzyme YbaK/EbsC (Cys-tRNA(Pro) deacylase)